MLYFNFFLIKNATLYISDHNVHQQGWAQVRFPLPSPSARGRRHSARPIVQVIFQSQNGPRYQCDLWKVPERPRPESGLVLWAQGPCRGQRAVHPQGERSVSRAQVAGSRGHQAPPGTQVSAELPGQGGKRHYQGGGETHLGRVLRSGAMGHEWTRWLGESEVNASEKIKAWRDMIRVQ